VTDLELRDELAETQKQVELIAGAVSQAMEILAERPVSVPVAAPAAASVDLEGPLAAHLDPITASLRNLSKEIRQINEKVDRPAELPEPAQPVEDRTAELVAAWRAELAAANEQRVQRMRAEVNRALAAAGAGAGTFAAICAWLFLRA
jgi:transketolase